MILKYKACFRYQFLFYANSRKIQSNLPIFQLFFCNLYFLVISNCDLAGLTGFLFASQFLSCVIACERCFCVVSPFKAQKYFKTSTMAVIISVVCFVLVAGIWVIAGNKHIVVCEFNPVTNRTSNVLAFTS